MAGQTVTTEGNSQVLGDVSVGGQDATLNGQIGRDLAVGSSNATVNGKVGRNVQADAEHLSLGGDAAVKGSITYTSANNLNKANSAQVAGKVTHNQPKPAEKHQGRGDAWIIAVWFFVSMLLLALVLVLLMPRVFQRSVTGIRSRLGKVFLLGFVASIMMPITIIVLFATLVGIPLAILLLLSWLVVQILAGPFAAFLLGRALFRSIAKSKTNSSIWTMLLGAVVLLAVYFIPILGFIVVLIALWIGMGMVLQQLWHLLRYDRSKVHRPTPEVL